MSHADLENPHASDQQTKDACPECGAKEVGGRAGCESLFDEFRYQALSNPKVGAVHWLAFDTYCMQHVATYCASAKSYAAHLTRLCCGIEYKGSLDIYAAIPRWLNGAVELEKPSILTNRGTMTFADVHNAPNLDEEVERVHVWAKHVWIAYHNQHELAHQWIHQALAFRPPR